MSKKGSSNFSAITIIRNNTTIFKIMKVFIGKIHKIKINLMQVKQNILFY